MSRRRIGALPAKDFDGLFLHSRDVYVLLSGLRCAGVFSGLDSEARISSPDDPPARRRGGFFNFQPSVDRNRPLPATVNCFQGAGGEVANAQVCKTCTRGFNSRPALQAQMQA